MQWTNTRPATRLAIAADPEVLIAVGKKWARQELPLNVRNLAMAALFPWMRSMRFEHMPRSILLNRSREGQILCGMPVLHASADAAAINAVAVAPCALVLRSVGRPSTPRLLSSVRSSAMPSRLWYTWSHLNAASTSWLCPLCLLASSLSVFTTATPVPP